MEKQTKDQQIERLLDDAFSSFPDIHLPGAFAENLVTRVEKRLRWMAILSEFGLKIGLVILILGLLSVVWLFPYRSSETVIPSLVLRYLEIIIGIAIIAFFTFLFDQVVLRYLLTRKRQRINQP